MSDQAFRNLARRLDALPQGYPPTADGVEIKLLAMLFSAEEAELASQLRLTRETPQQIAERLGGDPQQIKGLLKGMAKRGLIEISHQDGQFVFGLMPFVVGIYEMQVGRMDKELATLFESYYQQVFGKTLTLQPSFHRVIPVNETVHNDLEVHPYENARDIISAAKSWGVTSCICRQQQAQLGNDCGHPQDVCMTFSTIPGRFDGSSVVRAQTRQEALDTLQRAADAGLVHSVSNNQEGLWYICNCCTCSCGILRGIAELGIANAIAVSGFINSVDADLCTGCETCLDYCQFEALAIDDVMTVSSARCVGCGVCVPQCPDQAMTLVRRPEGEVPAPPLKMHDWLVERAAVRGQRLEDVL